MYLAVETRRRSSGTRGGPYYRIVHQAGGHRYRTRVRRGWAPVVVLLERLRRRTAADDQALLRTARRAVTGGRPGRPPVIPRAARELLTAAGYHVAGSRVMDPAGAWQDAAAMQVRFGLLAPAWQQTLGTPEGLARLLQRAWSRLKGANRRRVKGYAWNTALAEALHEIVADER